MMAHDSDNSTKRENEICYENTERNDNSMVEIQLMITFSLKEQNGKRVPNDQLLSYLPKVQLLEEVRVRFSTCGPAHDMCSPLVQVS